MQTLTVKTLREMLDYDHLSGEFTWRVRPSANVYPGHRAGSIHCKGYRHIKILGRLYLEHSLAVLYMTGNFHTGEIDHINGIKADNRFSNLRCVDKSVNLQNQKRAHKNSKSGLLGVSKHGRRWRASIKVRGERIHLGLFATPDSAHLAYVLAKRRLHEGGTL